MLKKFLSYYRPYKKMLLLLLLGAAIRASLELFFPYAVKIILEEQLPVNNLSLLLRGAVVLLLLYLVSFGIHFFVSYGGYKISSLIEKDMRCDLFRHLQGLSFSFYDRNKSGQLLSRITSDLSEVGELASRGPNDIVICSLSMLGTMIILMLLNPFLGFIIAILLLGKTVHTIYINQRMKKAFYANRTANGELAAKASESIEGIRLIKAFALEEQDFRVFCKKATRYAQVCSNSFKLRSYFMGSMLFFSNFINIIILLIGGVLIHKQQLTFGELVAFFLYVGMFMKPLMQLLGFSELYQRGMAGFTRFYEIMQEQAEIADNNDAKDCKTCKGEIEFSHVDFAYPNGDLILKDFSLTIKPGTKIAFVGATGAGKTTITNLLLRFYEPIRGKILLDGLDIKQIKQQSLRKQIGLVQQDVFLFDDSVENNIAYGDLDCDSYGIRKAAQAAAANDFINKLPQGYSTTIGERGVKLSGGQKQRIAIARVFLKNPPILVLDEATSALDNITEKQIQKELDYLSQGRTTIIIAHRLSTINNADKIVVLDDGKIVEQGNHDELLQRKGRYYSLYNQEQRNGVGK